MPAMDPRPLLQRCLAAGLAAVDPARCLPPCLPGVPPAGRTLVAGAGKAAASMALALSGATPWPVTGVVVTRYGHGLRTGEAIPGVDVLAAGHPVPDQASVEAGARILALARSAGPADRLIFLISGGASALMVQPAPGLTLADKQAVTRQLLAAGAGIAEINCVRRKLSAVKGGRLAAGLAAREIWLLALSDVPGDAIGDIGSGPLSPDRSSLADAREILGRYRIEVGPAVAACLAEPARQPPAAPEPALARIQSRLVARSADAVAAAAETAALAGYEPVVLAEGRGPAGALAGAHAMVIRQLKATGRRAAVISGGETTVAVRDPRIAGGRNGEYALALALALGAEGVHALAVDTDGLDGSGDNAGVFLTPDILARGRAAGLDAARLLAENRALQFFTALGELVVTGPTRTNANDLRITLVN